MTEWNNIRRWVAWNPSDGRPGALFTTVNALKSPVGRVLRWAGNFTSPFEFVEVGQLSEVGTADPTVPKAVPTAGPAC